MAGIIKAVAYLALGIIAMLFGAKTRFTEEDMDTIEYPDVDLAEIDSRFLESMYFHPYWLDKGEDVALSVRNKALDLLEQGMDIEQMLKTLKEDHPDQAIEYFYDVLFGLYPDEIPAE